MTGGEVGEVSGEKVERKWRKLEEGKYWERGEGKVDELRGNEITVSRGSEGEIREGT